MNFGKYRKSIKGKWRRDRKPEKKLEQTHNVKFLEYLTQKNTEEELSGTHPLLKDNPNIAQRIAYYNGAILAALIDDGKLSPGEEKALRTLAVSLGLSDEDCKEAIRTVQNLKDGEEQYGLVAEIISEFEKPWTSMLFLCDFIGIAFSTGHNLEEMDNVRDALVKQFHQKDNMEFFRRFSEMVSCQPEERREKYIALRDLCPENFRNYLAGFFPEESDSHSSPITEHFYNNPEILLRTLLLRTLNELLRKKQHNRASP